MGCRTQTLAWASAPECTLSDGRLFHVTWEFIDATEDGQRRSLKVFSGWQPPEGAEFHGFYGFVDGGGGVAIIEAESAAARPREDNGAMDAVAAIHLHPDYSDRESAAIAGEGVQFRDSVG
jgi:Protein of unknown function (DUF3303)